MIATFFSSETKWINQIWKLKEQYPDEVEIRHVNSDGSLIAHKKKVVMTEEQIAASKARLEKGRLKRLEMLGDDAHVTEERNNEI